MNTNIFFFVAELKISVEKAFNCHMTKTTSYSELLFYKF